MAFRLVLATVGVSVLLVAVSAGSARSTAAPAGTGVVFSVFENLPPNGACPGLYAVDARTRQLEWIGGWDARREDSAVYPAFTARGTISYGHWVDPSSNAAPLVDVYAAGRTVARAYVWSRWAWSPRREEVAFGRVAAGGRRLELVLGSVSGSTRLLAPSSALGLSWLPDGSGLVYGRRVGETDVVTFVRRDGRGRRDLARNAFQPLVSPDGRRVAFLRPTSPEPGIIRPELWVVGTDGKRARNVLGPVDRESLRPMAWLSNRELLVQRGGKRNSIFNARDTVNRVNVDTRRERLFLRRGFALSLSPDRSRVLFVRPHTAAGETYYSIRTVRADGRDERLLAVTDEEDLNVGSFPVWKAAGVRVGWLGDPMPAGTNAEECAARLTSLRDRTR